MLRVVGPSRSSRPAPGVVQLLFASFRSLVIGLASEWYIAQELNYWFNCTEATGKPLSSFRRLKKPNGKSDA